MVPSLRAWRLTEFWKTAISKRIRLQGVFLLYSMLTFDFTKLAFLRVKSLRTPRPDCVFIGGVASGGGPTELVSSNCAILSHCFSIEPGPESKLKLRQKTQRDNKASHLPAVP